MWLVGLAALASAVTPLAAPQINVTKCLAEHCVPQVKACAADKTCNGGIKCIEKCPTPPTTACVKACIQHSLDGAMIEVGLCASSHGCIPTDAVPPYPNASSVELL